MSKVESLLGEVERGAGIADALVSAGLIDQAAARRARQVASASGESIVAVVHQLALCDDAQVLKALADRFGLKTLADDELPDAAIELKGVAAAFLRQQRILPLGWSGEHLLVGVIDPEQSDGLAALAFAAQRATEPRLMSVSAQRRAFEALYGAGEEAAEDANVAPSIGTWADDAQRMRDQSSA